MKLPKHDDLCISTGEKLSMNARPWLTKKNSNIQTSSHQINPSARVGFWFPCFQAWPLSHHNILSQKLQPLMLKISVKKIEKRSWQLKIQDMDGIFLGRTKLIYFSKCQSCSTEFFSQSSHMYKKQFEFGKEFIRLKNLERCSRLQMPMF